MELKHILESILFSAQKPLRAREIRDVLAAATEADDAPPEAKAFASARESAIAAALEELAGEHETANRSYRLVCVADAWQFVTQPAYAPWLRALVGMKARPPRLSQPALETLAIIAYRQPITRAEVEQIRGVSVDGVMQTIMERGFVEAVGRAEVVGRPPTYGTTALFLEYFGLRSLEDLPAADELRKLVIQKPPGPVTADAGLATPPPATLKEQDERQNEEKSPAATAKTANPDEERKPSP